MFFSILGENTLVKATDIDKIIQISKHMET